MNEKWEAEDYILRSEELGADRFTWERTWQDIIDVTLPNRSPVIYDDMPGEVRTTELYDSTAVKTNANLAAAIGGMLTNQNTEWFKFEIDDKELMKDTDVVEWLEDVETTVKKSLDNSNFYLQAHEYYLDLTSVGTAVMFIEDSKYKNKDLNFQTRHIREIYLAEDAEGLVDTVYRKFTMTIRQMCQKWPDKPFDQKVLDLIEAGELDTEIEILHCVQPRTDFEKDKKDKKNMPYVSCWIDVENKHMISESGYREFPYVVTRWLKSSNEVYGRSPALSALPDIKTLNEMMKTMLMTAQRIADPPVQAPEEMIGHVNLEPGTTNYYDATTNARIEPITIGANLPVTVDLITAYRESIKDIFLETKLHLIDQKYMSAEEARTRTQENARILGPTFGRLTFEFLDRLMYRILSILQINGKLPQAPDGIGNLELKYVSPLAKAQNAMEVQIINYAIQLAGQYAALKPEVLDNIDFDKAYRRLIDLSGATIIMHSVDEVEKLREQRAQQQQQQAQMQQQAVAVELQEKQAAANKQTAMAAKYTAAAQKDAVAPAPQDVMQ